MHEEVKCPYCGALADYVDSAQVYQRSYGMIYRCTPCDAYVGTHRSGWLQGKPLGTLANAELRKLRQETHRIFDALWNRQGAPLTRTAAYEWLSRAMGLPSTRSHIAMFDEGQCRKAIQAVQTRDVPSPSFQHFGGHRHHPSSCA